MSEEDVEVGDRKVGDRSATTSMQGKSVAA